MKLTKIPFLIFVFLGATVLIAVLVAAWFLLTRGPDYRLSELQIEQLGLGHWTPMEVWAFEQMRKDPGSEIRFAEFEGQGATSISSAFIEDALNLTTDLDGTGPRVLNFNGAVIQGDLDLQNTELERVRLVGTTIGGKLSMADLRVLQQPGRSPVVEQAGDLTFWDVTVGGIADFTNLRAKDLTITGLEGASFVLLSGVRLNSLTLSESYGLDLLAVLRAEVMQEFVVRDVEIASDFVLQGTSAGSLAFENMKIGGQLDGVGMAIDRDVLLSGVEVEQELILTSSAIGGDFIAKQGVSAKSALTDATVAGQMDIAIQRRP